MHGGSKMIQKYENSIWIGNKETKIVFHLWYDNGWYLQEAEYIRLLAKKYLEKYPQIRLNLICDYCSLDYGDEVNETNYFYDGEKEYDARDDCAMYWEKENMIGFNHILCSSLKFECLYESSLDEILRVSMLPDIEQIKTCEKSDSIRSVFIHEFGHAIEYQLRVYEDSRVIELYQESNAEKVFEDIHEFIAECFVTREYFKNNKIVNRVMDVIYDCMKNNY